jgi:hypothetical protein
MAIRVNYSMAVGGDGGAGIVRPLLRPGGRLAESPPYAADEIRAALAWTRRAADREHSFAETLVQRMPAVFAALNDGRIDRAKAWIFTDHCAELPTDQAAAACARIEDLAKAAKRAGHPGRVGHLRADLYLGLLAVAGNR